MYVNIIIYSNKLLLFVWSTLNKEKKKKKFNSIIRELVIEDRMGFKEMFRISVENFEFVLKHDNSMQFEC